MKFRKFLLALGAFIVLTTVSISCKKNNPTLKNSVTGTKWFYTNPIDPKDTYPENLTLIFENDTKLMGKFNGHEIIPGSGSYTFSNNTVVGIFKITDNNAISTFTFNGVLNADGTRINLAIGLPPDNNNAINLILTKQ
jgi:hypothetical protein